MSEDITPTFSELVREWRTQAGLTQEKLSALSDEAALVVARRYPEEKNVRGLSRELINQWESGKFDGRPRDKSIMVLVTALAEAHQRLGLDSDPIEMFDLANASLQVAVPVQAVSSYAVILEGLLLSFPKRERKAKWKAIIALVRTERDERIKAQQESDVR